MSKPDLVNPKMNYGPPLRDNDPMFKWFLNLLVLADHRHEPGYEAKKAALLARCPGAFVETVLERARKQWADAQKAKR